MGYRYSSPWSPPTYSVFFSCGEVIRCLGPRWLFFLNWCRECFTAYVVFLFFLDQHLLHTSKHPFLAAKSCIRRFSPQLAAHHPLLWLLAGGCTMMGPCKGRGDHRQCPGLGSQGSGAQPQGRAHSGRHHDCAHPKCLHPAWGAVSMQSVSRMHGVPADKQPMHSGNLSGSCWGVALFGTCNCAHTHGHMPACRQPSKRQLWISSMWWLMSVLHTDSVPTVAKL